MTEINLEKSMEKFWGKWENVGKRHNNFNEHFVISTPYNNVELLYFDERRSITLGMYRVINKRNFEEALANECLLIGNRRIFLEKAGHNTSRSQEMWIDREPDCVKVTYTCSMAVQNQEELDELCKNVKECLIAEGRK